MLFKEDKTARAEHEAVRNNIGWYRWTHDLVEVTGKDARNFLDYLYVNAIYKTPAGRTKYTTMLNEDGKIIDDVIVMHMEENLYWVSTLYAPQLIAWMDGHKEGYEVEYRDITKDLDMYSVQGPNSPKMIAGMAADSIEELAHFGIMKSKVGEVPVWLHRSGFTGEEGYEIYCAMEDSEKILNALKEAAPKFDAVEVRTLEVYVRSLPVEKGFALRQDFYGLSPYEAGLGWSVDLTKEFIGKEAALLVKEKGAKYKLVGLEYLAESYEDIAQKERVYDRGVDIGFVRTAVYGYSVEKNIGFAVVRADKATLGRKLTIGTNRSPAVVVKKKWL